MPLLRMAALPLVTLSTVPSPVMVRVPLLVMVSLETLVRVLPLRSRVTVTPEGTTTSSLTSSSSFTVLPLAAAMASLTVSYLTPLVSATYLETTLKVPSPLSTPLKSGPAREVTPLACSALLSAGLKFLKVPPLMVIFAARLLKFSSNALISTP